MTEQDNSSHQSQAKDAVLRMQHFDTTSLPQERRLGTVHNFSNAIEPATRLIDLYEQLPVDAIDLLPDGHAENLKRHADADYNRLESILSFDPELGNNAQRIEKNIQGLTEAYEATFNVLHPWISFSVRRSTDLSALERDARAIAQSLKDTAAGVQDEIEATQAEANRVLDDVRRVAEEQGVSQQAHYFSTAAADHDTKASNWFKTTRSLAIGLGAFAVLALFVHKIPWLNSGSAYDAIQLGVSKLMMFGVLSYMLALASRNFMAHRHNAAVNRHRQDALQTYETIVNAGQEQGTRDIVLNHAAQCIFEPKPTGFTKADNSEPASTHSLISLLQAGSRNSTLDG